MNKKNFIAPEMEITTWEKTDVIATSTQVANYTPAFGNSDLGQVTAKGNLDDVMNR